MFKRIFLSLMALVVVGAVSVPVFASPSFIVNDDGVVAITSPVGDDAYIAGGDVAIDSDVRGDLFIGGGTIIVNADVSGDLFIGGGQISIRGNVSDDIRIGGGTVTIHGNVGDDVFVGGGTVTIADTSTIRGDLLVGSGEFNLFGDVVGSVKAGFGSGRIRGNIGGDADLRYGDGKLTFADGAKIGGKLDYWALGENSVFADIANEVEFHKWVGDQTSSVWPAMAAVVPLAMVTGALWSFLGILALGGLMILMLPKYLPRIVATAKKDYWNGLWQGILVLIVLPIIALLIAFTGFGWPISILIMFGYVSVMILASVPVSMAIGSYIIKYTDANKGKQFGSLALGAAIYLILGMIPFIGWIIRLLLFVASVGVIFMDARVQIKKGNY